MKSWLVGLLALALLAIPVSASADGPDTYVVNRGDNLETIARIFSTSVSDLMTLNGIANPDRIKAGQQLLVPGTNGVTTHVVVAGDTLLDLAERHGISVNELAAANGMGVNDLIRIGQSLKVPTRSAAPRGGSRSEVTDSSSGDPFDPGILPYLTVPYRTQYDGTRFEDSNCGPATLGMAMAFYGEWWFTDGIRRDVNSQTGDYSLDGGSSWESLAYAARKRGFVVQGVVQGNDYRRWTIDDLVDQVGKGYAPILLVRYRNLPGHESSSWWGDHYIIFLGLTADGRVVYHDSAFKGSEGAFRTMSQKQLQRAWSTNIAGIQYSAMVVVWP